MSELYNKRLNLVKNYVFYEILILLKRLIYNNFCYCFMYYVGTRGHLENLRNVQQVFII
jgi:hypothetical protein